MNELALLAERVGADIELVRKGIGSDPRIGTHFLYPGAGYGGSCFPKDVKALVHTARDNGVTLQVLTAVEAANEKQKHVLVDKIVKRFGEDLSGRQFAIWGLAFKPNTDDMRDAPSRIVIAELAKRGAKVKAYDPVANTWATLAPMQVARVSPGIATDGAGVGLARADEVRAAIERLRAWIALPTIANMGVNTPQGAEYMRQLALDAGFQQAKVVESGGVPGVFATLDAGAKRIIVCLGGSATTDGGLGAVRAIHAPRP